MIATDGIDLGADSGFDFYILFHLQKNIEAVVPEEESQEESSRLEAMISEIMPLKNFLKITAAKKCKRIASATFASQTSSDPANADWQQHLPIVVAEDSPLFCSGFY